MSPRDVDRVRDYPPTNELIRRLTDDVARRSNRRRRRQKRELMRFAKAGCAILAVTFIIIPTMIAGGFLLGPHGVEGLVAAPLLLLTAWSGILYWAFKGGAKRLPAPAVPALGKGADLSQLPEQTDRWLDEQRGGLPVSSHVRLDSIGVRLEALTLQLQGASEETPAISELRKLLVEELPELVRGYRKVPRALQHKAQHGGLSPERQVVEGLTTIDEALGRLQEQIADNDLRSLSVHQRYLDMKYKRDGEM